MKITGISATPLRTGPIIVRVQTDEGLEGLGECSGADESVLELPDTGRNRKVLKTFIEDVLGPVAAGQDPRETERLWDRMFHDTHRLGPMGMQMTGIGAVNIACWDILGKSLGLPLHVLLGGAARKRVPVYHSSGSGWRLSPEQMLEAVQEGWEAGFRAFKIRMDWNSNRQDADPRKDLEMFRLVRERLPEEISLSFDANNGYSVGTAITQGKRFQELGIAHFEEPVPQYDYQGLRQVADALDVPVSSGEQEHTRWGFRDLILHANPDILQPDIVTSGGISEVRRIYTLAETFNKPVMPHCPSAGIAVAASLHLYCTLTNAVRPHEYSYEFSGGAEAAAGVFRAPLNLSDGFVDVPDSPGLGLTLDDEAVAALAVNE